MTIQTVDDWISEGHHDFGKYIKQTQYRKACEDFGGQYQYVTFFRAEDDEFTHVVRNRIRGELSKMENVNFVILGHSMGFHVLFESFTEALEFTMTHGNGE
jgi:hypothetical protein